MKNNRKIGFLAVIGCILLVACLSGTAVSADIVLGRGESRILPVQHLSRVAVADPEIADVLVINNTDLLITAKSLGTTTLHLWEKSGRTSYSLRVVTNTADLARELQDLIGLSGVHVRIVEDTVIVDGTVSSEEEHQRAIRAAGAYGDQVIDLLRVNTAKDLAESITASDISSFADESVVSQLESVLQEPDVTVTKVGNTLLLEGTVSSPLRQTRAIAIAQALGYQVVDLLVVPDPPTAPVPPFATSSDDAALKWLAELIDMDTVRLRLIAGVIFVEGEVSSELEKEKVEAIVEAAGFRYKSFLTISSSLGVENSPERKEINWTQVIEEISKLVGDSRLGFYTVNDRLFIEGQVETTSEKTRAEKIANAFVPSDQLVSLIQVVPPRPSEVPKVNAPVDNTQVGAESDETSRLKGRDAAADEQETRLQALEKRIQSVITYPGVQVQIVEHTVILSGEVLREDHVKKAEQLAEIFGLPVVNLLSVAPAPERPSNRSEEIQTMIGLASVRVTEAAGKILLEGHVQTQLEYGRAERIAGLYSTEVVNLLKVDQPQQVLLQIRVIEASKNAMEKLGITWGNLSPVFTPHVAYLGQNEVLGPLEFLSRLGGEIEILVNNGEARLLAKPSILTLSGKEASFLAGGEIPVVVPSGDQTAVEWKEYGVKLDVTPVVESSGQITVTLRPEVSSLDWANAVKLNTAVIPAMKTRRTETTVSLTDGGTLALGGLIQSNDSRQVDKVPILGDLPIIGALFRSEQFQQEESELIFLVTCKVISGPADWATAAEMKLLTEQGGAVSE